MALGNILNFKKFKDPMFGATGLPQPKQADTLGTDTAFGINNTAPNTSLPTPKAITTPVESPVATQDTSSTLPMARGQVAAKVATGTGLIGLSPEQKKAITNSTPGPIDILTGGLKTTPVTPPVANTPIPSETTLPPAKTVDTAKTTYVDANGNVSDTPAPTAGQQAETILNQQVLNTANGQSPEVVAAKQKLDRENTLRLDQAQRQAHETAVRSGYMPGTAQYDAMMRNASDAANNSNIEATNKFNEFARTTREGNQSSLAALGQRDYQRANENKTVADKNFETALASAGSEAAKTALTQNYLKGTPAGDFLNTMIDPTTHILKKDFQDPNFAQHEKDNFIKSFDTVSVDPTTGTAWASPAAKTDYLEKTWGQMLGQTYNPVTEQGTIDKERIAGISRLNSYLSTGDKSKITADDWKYMKGEDLVKAQEGVNPKIRNVDNLTESDVTNMLNNTDPNTSSLRKGDIVMQKGHFYEVKDLTPNGKYHQDLILSSVDGGTNTTIHMSQNPNRVLNSRV